MPFNASDVTWAQQQCSAVKQNKIKNGRSTLALPHSSGDTRQLCFSFTVRNDSVGPFGDSL